MKALTPGLAFLAIAALVACSSNKANDKGVTIQTSEGTASIGQPVDAGKLGAPVYPGATNREQGSITSTTDKGTSTIAAFKTADTFDQVYAYYKQQLPAGAEKMKMTSGNGSVASFQIGDATAADQVTVQVSSDKPRETDILITHVTKSGAAPSPSPESSG